jgi:hexosaminidase
MLKNYFYITLLCLLFFSCSDELKIIPFQDNVQLVPSAKEITFNDKALLFPKKIKLFLSDSIYKNPSKIFFKNLSKLGFHSKYSLSDRNAAHVLIVRDSSLSSDQYKIEIKEKVIIYVSTISSLSYALNSLLQIAKLKNGRLVLQQIEINDFPDAEYRGLMIDLARQWHSVETLEKLIDLSSFYKLNYIQFHLTDDQSFTFPSDSYPKLKTENRYYTKDELTYLVDYAYNRGIIIIPEIDVPGHSAKFIESYPEIFAPSRKKDLGLNILGHQATNNVINIGSEKVYSALESIFEEVIEIFYTSPYFHIGADEATLSNLIGDPQVEALMKRESLGTQIDELYRYFIVRMNDMLKKKNKIMCIWEGFKRDGKVPIPKDIIVFPFESLYNLPNHLLEDGYKLVNSSWTPLYVVGSGVKGEWIPRKWSPEKIYEWNMWQWENWYHKSPASIKPIQLDKSTRVIGAQMCAWEQTDEAEIPSLRRRIPTFSERVWNTEQKLSFNPFYEILDGVDSKLSFLVNSTKQDSLLIGYNIKDNGKGVPVRTKL